MPFVDVLDRAEAVLVGADGIEQIRHEQSIDDEAGPIGRGNRLLAERTCERGSRSDRSSSLVVSARITSTSFISGTGLKKCSPTKRSARSVAAASSVMHKRRGVRREHGFGPDQRLELVKRVLLRLELLDDRLDDETAGREVGEARRPRQVFERGVARLGRHLALLDADVEHASDAAQGPSRGSTGPLRARACGTRPPPRPARCRRPSDRSRARPRFELVT